MSDGIKYTDGTTEFTETTTSPGMAVIREEELTEAGYTIIE